MTFESSVLAVFAHPDDETLTAAGLLALLARTADVHVVTTNRGERGEIIPPDIAHFEGDDAEVARLRSAELDKAATALGITSHVFLDELAPNTGVHFADSGMAWANEQQSRATADPKAGPHAFSRADSEFAARLLAGHIRTLKPSLIITDEPGGGYGHPDHVRCSAVVSRAVELAAASDPSLSGNVWVTPSLAWVVRPAGVVREANRWLAQEPMRPQMTALGRPLKVASPDGELASIAVDLSEVDVQVDTWSVANSVLEAIRCYRSQVQDAALAPGALSVPESVDNPKSVSAHARPIEAIGWFALSNDILQPIYSRVWLRSAPGFGHASTLTNVLNSLIAGPSASPVTQVAHSVDAPWQQPEAGAEMGQPGGATTPMAGNIGAAAAPLGPSPAADQFEPAPRWYNALMLVFAAIMGVVFGAVGTVFHRWQMPWGIVIALIAVIAAGVLARSFADRKGVFAFFVAVFVTVFATTWWRPGGDVLVTNEAIGYVWLFGSIIASGIALVLPRRWFIDRD